MSKNNYAMKSQKDSENYGKDMNKEADNDLLKYMKKPDGNRKRKFGMQSLFLVMSLLVAIASLVYLCSIRTGLST